MNQAQSYRGPDGQGVWTDGRVRLALVGDAERGKEPLADEGGAQLTFNGDLPSGPTDAFLAWSLGLERPMRELCTSYCGARGQRAWPGSKEPLRQLAAKAR